MGTIKGKVKVQFCSDFFTILKNWAAGHNISCFVSLLTCIFSIQKANNDLLQVIIS